MLPISSIPMIPSLDDSSYQLSEELNDKQLANFGSADPGIEEEKFNSDDGSPIDLAEVKLPSFYVDDCTCKATALILDTATHSLKSIVDDLDHKGVTCDVVFSG